MSAPYVNADGRTSCCGAYSTFVDDGIGGFVEVCKRCYADVVADPTSKSVVVELDESGDS